MLWSATTTGMCFTSIWIAYAKRTSWISGISRMRASVPSVAGHDDEFLFCDCFNPLQHFDFPREHLLDDHECFPYASELHQSERRPWPQLAPGDPWETWCRLGPASYRYYQRKEHSHCKAGDQPRSLQDETSPAFDFRLRRSPPNITG